MRAQALMVVGTASHVGKSVVTTALCRIMASDGRRVAPFKALNMSLNAAVTPDGFEIARAQAVQAEAAGIAPSRHMNPILLKPSGGGRSQLVLQGRAVAAAEAQALDAGALWSRVRESLEALAAGYDVLVIEGAGSPVELNLRQRDLGNMRVAEAADAAVLLVADIDRGGVFASVHGTLALMSPDERRRVGGVAVNRFRGDPGGFAEGRRLLEHLARRPVLGVIPFIEDLGIDEEDGVGLASPRYRVAPGHPDALKVAIVALPHLSNFTDFDPLFQSAGVEPYFCAHPRDLGAPQLIILPGTKNTPDDLAWLWRSGFARSILAHHGAGGHVLGICGGYQMLGRVVCDPGHVESSRTEVAGLGLVDAVTTLTAVKRTARVTGTLCALFPGTPLAGYELHAGETAATGPVLPLARVLGTGDAGAHDDGCVAHDGRVVGTYLHGVLDGEAFRSRYLRHLSAAFRLPPLPARAPTPVDPVDRLAAVVREHLDMDRVYGLMAALR